MHSPETILVVDDEANTRQLFEDLLEKQGYRVITTGNSQTALYTARREQPDLVLLDLFMAGMNGYHFLTQFRKECPTPVILLAPNEEEIDIALGLDLGADDCVTRPFRLHELLARIRALIRRNGQTIKHSTDLNINGLNLDESAHEVKVQGRLVDLTPIELVTECDRTGRFKERQG
jgi:two-component system alkaline phosphatase synthesis response regulator PhoP